MDWRRKFANKGHLDTHSHSKNTILCYIKNRIMIHLYFKSFSSLMVPALSLSVLVLPSFPPKKFSTFNCLWDLIDVTRILYTFLFFWSIRWFFLLYQWEITLSYSSWEKVLDICFNLIHFSPIIRFYTLCILS